MKYPLFVLLSLLAVVLCAQDQDKVDFRRGTAVIAPIPEGKRIDGNVIYDFEVFQKVDSVFLDARNMVFSSVKLNGKKIKYSNNGTTISIKNRFKEGKNYKLDLAYSCIPKQTVYFLGWDDDIQGNEQIWTQGQGKYTSHWLPSFDDMTEKVEFDLNIIFNEKYKVIANGRLKATSKEVPASLMWSYDMQSPMSSYLVAFAIGTYDKHELTSTSAIPIENYYYPQDSLRMEPTYRYTKEIFDFLEEEIGVPYPWKNYKQIPVRDFLYAGMENTGATIFSDGYVVDSMAFVDRNYVNVNAHEMAHQWFGNLVTEVSGSSHWLHEGFATYYALLAEKELFGKEHYYWKLYESAIQLQALSNKNMGEALIDPKAGSLTFYEKGAWALHVLRDQIGEKDFKRGIQQFLKKYGYKNVTVNDFLVEMEQVTGRELDTFRKQWLEDEIFPFDEAKNSLVRESEDLSLFFKLQKEMMTSSAVNETIIRKYWESTNSDQLKAKIIETFYKSISEDFIKEVFGSNNVLIRQALAVSVEQISAGMKSQYESLLDDESYKTKEEMLYKLWINYPDERVHYLDMTKNFIGFSNKNIRILWLTLALLTKDYEPANTNDHYMELSGYTSEVYSHEVRQGAFQFIDQLIGFSDRNLLDLINATQHHSWQFQKYARTLMDRLLVQKEYKDRIERLKIKLNGIELRYINNKLISE